MWPKYDQSDISREDDVIKGIEGIWNFSRKFSPSPSLNRPLLRIIISRLIQYEEFELN